MRNLTEKLNFREIEDLKLKFRCTFESNEGLDYENRT